MTNFLFHCIDLTDFIVYSYVATQVQNILLMAIFNHTHFKLNILSIMPTSIAVLMFKFCRMKKRIPCRLVVGCGSCGMCLYCTLPGVQVTAGLGFFLCSGQFCIIVKIVTPCSARLSLPCRSLVG